MIHKRNCPKCNTEIEYTNKGSWYNAKARNSKCIECANKNISKTLKKKYKSGELTIVTRYRTEKNHFKNCPDCGNEMGYTTVGGLNNAIIKNTICNSCSTKKHKKGVSFNPTETSIKQMRATKAGFSTWDEYVEKYPEKEMYKREVWKYTYRNDVTVLPNNDKRGRCGVDGAYQLDHIISINEGWEKNIPAEEIGSMNNLQIITWEENRKKW